MRYVIGLVIAVSKPEWLNLLATRSKHWVCGCSLAGIAGLNPAGVMNVCRECWVLSGTGLCDGPIPRLEESYRVCVSLNVMKCNNNPLHLQ